MNKALKFYTWWHHKLSWTGQTWWGYEYWEQQVCQENGGQMQPLVDKIVSSAVIPVREIPELTCFVQWRFRDWVIPVREMPEFWREVSWYYYFNEGRSIPNFKNPPVTPSIILPPFRQYNSSSLQFLFSPQPSPNSSIPLNNVYTQRQAPSIPLTVNNVYTQHQASLLLWTLCILSNKQPPYCELLGAENTHCSQ